MNGFVRLLKPPGMTSHDAVAVTRRLLRTRAIGHTGTLDPAAAGLLVLTVGAATRLGEYLADCDKAYRAEVMLGLSTTTADAQGEILVEASAAHVTAAALEHALATLRGRVTMRPPAHSAVRVDGRKAYEFAHAGKPVETPERTVEITRLDLLEFVPGSRALVRLDLDCSKGTYVRSLAQMLGEALGCGGMLAALLRTRVGPHSLAQAVTFEDVAAAPEACVLPPAEGLPHLPRIVVQAAEQRALSHGNAVPWSEPPLPAGPLVVLDQTGEMLAIAERGPEGALCPRKVIAAAG